MRTAKIVLPLLVGLSVSLLGAVSLVAARPFQPNDLKVHEWGTFLVMNGSDGVALDGMYHEEHALPAFVHARSKDQLRLPSTSLKGETPVIYFYTDQPQSVNVRVKFPEGIWTQWYPQASRVSPSTTQAGSLPQLRDGHICWNVDVKPAHLLKTPPALPETASDALWNHARQVDAAYVSTRDYTTRPERREYERFIFYRGLGRATLPLQMTAPNGGTLTYRSTEPLPIRHLYILQVENGKGVYRYLPSLAPGESLTQTLPDLQKALPLKEFTQRISADLANRLTESGLYSKEAQAMVNTWRNSYFENPGIRVLFVLPQAWTDRFIPMEVFPQPKEITRVMVGRLEVLTPQREKNAEFAIRNLASPDAKTREQAFTWLRNQGRYVEPIVRRTLQQTQEETVRLLCKRLLYTDFVTELRSSVHQATTGFRQTDDPLHARAQLASLLREIGQTDQAKNEAQAVYQELQQRPTPPIHDSDFRAHGRAYARTMEALGKEAEAAHWYKEFVRFGSQLSESNACGGCHEFNAPHRLAEMQDWWAGKKFAEYTARTQGLSKAIAEQEARLAQQPHDKATLLQLAYLAQAKGDKTRHAQLWGQLTGKPPTRTARR